MKKVFAFLTLAAFMAACNNSSDVKETETATDTSVTTETSIADTTQKAADTIQIPTADTTAKQ